MKHLTGTLGLVLLIAAAISAASAQEPSPVLDTSGQPLRRGVEYIIRPAITDVGGPFTLIDRNDSCPLYVGQVNAPTMQAFNVTFEPFDGAESVVRESRDFKVTFSALSTCVMSTAWKVDHNTEVDGRRLIATGEDNSSTLGFLANYFLIRRGAGGLYNIEWCPAALCPTCRLRCGSLGNLLENGKLLAALDANALPLEFVRAG